MRDCNSQPLSTTVNTQKPAEQTNGIPQSHEVKPQQFPEMSKQDLPVMGLACHYENTEDDNPKLEQSISHYSITIWGRREC